MSTIIKTKSAVELSDSAVPNIPIQHYCILCTTEMNFLLFINPANRKVIHINHSFFCKNRRLLFYMSRTLHLFGTDWPILSIKSSSAWLVTSAMIASGYFFKIFSLFFRLESISTINH